ncbi:arsenic transporter, partial [Dermatophilus congolensis]|nr:arsenic transporter [Dermatophilus congolensis]
MQRCACRGSESAREGFLSAARLTIVFTDTVIPVLERVAPVVAFLVTVTVLADVAQRVGVFDVAARWIAGWGRGRTFLLWWLFSVFAVVTTVFLSLDTTAVLLTPVALALARQVGVPVRPFAVTTLWIANTGSLLLPVSNLTNLMAVDRFARWGLGHGDYVALALWPGCVAIVVTLVCVVVMYPALVSGRYGVVPAGEVGDRVLLLVGFVVCGAVGPAFAVGVEPWV